MARQWSFRFASVCFALCLQGCNLIPYYYRGDGDFDNRWGEAAHSRYHLTLGEFNSSKPAKATFYIGKLPTHPITGERFNFRLGPTGIAKNFLFPSGYSVVSGNDDGRLEGMARVRLRLVENQTGTVIGEMDDSLSDWTWSQTFGSDDIREVSFSGILFDPVRGHTYTLTMEILEPDGYDIPLILEGSGGNVATYALF